MKIDFLSPGEGTNRAHYRDHLQPVWDALPDDARGEWLDSEAGPVYPVGNEDRAVLVVSDTDLRPARVRGYRRIAMLSHGIGQSYVRDDGSTYPAGILRQHVGLFLRPSDAAAARDRRDYPDATHVVVGSPRLDRLPRGPKKKGNVVAVSFHWTYGAIPETRSALHAYQSVLAELAERFTVIGHSHPLAADPRKAFEDAGIEFVPDFTEVCRRASLYACDNSSTLYEFAATNRPVVVLNTPDYRRDVLHGMRFWETANVGLQCDAPADLADTVSSALKDSLAAKKARKAALDTVYASRRGGAKRAVTAITEWLAA